MEISKAISHLFRVECDRLVGTTYNRGGKGIFRRERESQTPSLAIASSVSSAVRIFVHHTLFEKDAVLQRHSPLERRRGDVGRPAAMHAE
jgi:hypothetical protein